MRLLVFGATGMVGQGVMREALADPEISVVTTIGRTAGGLQNPKLREIIHPKLDDYTAIESDMAGFDACFFCLGVSSAGMTEAAYTQLTYHVTLAAAQTLSRLNPGMVFIYVSGASTDSSGQGRAMWARVKGQTENALLRLNFKAAYMFRPGVIQPLHGIRSKTASYRLLYNILGPVLPIFRRLLPNYILTTATIGQAMIEAARYGAAKSILESRDIEALAQRAAARRLPT